MNSLKVNQLIHSFKSFLNILVGSNELTANLQRKIDIMLFYLTRYPLDHHKMVQYSLNCNSADYQEKFVKENKLDVLVFSIKNILSQNSAGVDNNNYSNQDDNSYSLIQSANTDSLNQQSLNIDNIYQENPSLNQLDDVLNENNFQNNDQNIANRSMNLKNSILLDKVEDKDNVNNYGKLKKEKSPRNRIASANFLPDNIDTTPRRKQIPNEFLSDKKSGMQQSLEKNRLLYNKYNSLYEMIPEDNNYKKPIQNQNLDLNQNQNGNGNENSFQKSKLLSEVRSVISLMQNNTQFYKGLVKNQNDIYSKQQEIKLDLEKKYSTIFDSCDFLSRKNSIDVNQSMKKSLKNIVMFTRRDSRDQSFKQIQSDLNERLKQVKNNLTNITLHDDRERKQQQKSIPSQHQPTVSTQPQSLSDKYMIDMSKNNLSNNTVDINSPNTPLSLKKYTPITLIDKQNHQNTIPFSFEQEINQNPIQHEQNKQVQQNFFFPTSPFKFFPQEEAKLQNQTDQQQVQLHSDQLNVQQQPQTKLINNDFHASYEHTSPIYRHPYLENTQFPTKQGYQINGEQQKSNQIGQQYTTKQHDETFPFENLMQQHPSQNQYKDLNAYYNKEEVKSPNYVPQFRMAQPNKFNNDPLNKQYNDMSYYKKHLYIDQQKIY